MVLLLGCSAAWTLSGMGADAGSGEAGFKPLFNGRNLAGWVPVNVAPGTFTVRDGMIISTGVPTGVMRTTRHYENFVLELEWKHLRAGGNAGIFVHSDPVTAQGVPFTRSHEIQVIDGNHPEGLWTGHGDVFSIHGASFVPDRPHPQGWMRCLPSERRANPAGQWNHYRIECLDGRISLSVNGKQVSGGTRSNPRRGYICIESEGSECWFRNIRIKELPSGSVPAAEVAGLDEGYRSLYTGLDLDGWKPSANGRAAWKPSDWTLRFVPDPTGAPASLTATRSHRSADLILDYRWVGAAAESSHATLVVSPRGGVAGLTLVRGRAPVLTVGGMTLSGRGDLEKPEGQWNRCVLSVRGKRLEVNINGTQAAVAEFSPGLPSRGPLTLTGSGGGFELANLYSRQR